MPDQSYDLIIIGGGVNGCGVARDAAGRGLSVLLCEKKDLGHATSSASTKLIHGGLRYLEHCEFRLVRESLMERERLWASAPHIIRPLRFVLPHRKGMRPAWLLRLGLFFYDHLGGRKLLPATRMFDLSADPAGAPLKPGFRRAFEYSDCRVHDSRLVALLAMDAAGRGAEIRTRMEVVSAHGANGGWTVELCDADSGAPAAVRGRVLINAAGPWVEEVIRKRARRGSASGARLVRGSHIVTRRIFGHDRAYIFQNADNRIIFAIPYEGDFTLIGTTDSDHEGDPGAPVCTPEERAYLCAAASEYFDKPVREQDVVWSYSGIRPLYDDGVSAAQEATRDYVLELDAQGGAPMLNIFGGKITTFRRLAEAAMARIAPFFPAMGEAWTNGAVLPGGEFGVGEVGMMIRALRAEFPFVAEDQADRLIGAYGACAREMLEGAKSAADLGRDFGAGLTEREVQRLMKAEWARTAEDVLWRRSKLGLRLSAAQVAALDEWMQANRPRAEMPILALVSEETAA